MRNYLTVVGNMDGFTVMAGVFKAYDTVGLPLAIILDELSQQGIIIDWVDFYKSARKAGWNDHTIYTRAREAVSDVHSREYLTKWDELFKLTIRKYGKYA